MKVTLDYLDKILLENLSNINITNQKNAGEELDSLADPALSFLDDEEKHEKDRIQDLQRMKSVITDPFEKKSKDNAIKQSQTKLSKINQTRSTVMANQEKLKKQSIENQNDLQNQMSQLKQNAELLNKLKNQVQEVYDKNFSLPILKRAQLPNMDTNFELTEQVPGVQNPPVENKKSSFKVQFEKSSGQPFEVFFSERGFKIGDTRLSFETIEDAISKNFTITLDGGNGIVLDAVRMQKILKYKNRLV